ncbi:YkgJ family cysteine cluster protein [Microvenator marinus]|uniref:YkgJ family cysteine cluster protein n=1 Tax=Microvenator marinus TaxID=2600177 RepID=A0A5B8XR80_9DELT|nr:YkgJ family cysteine cluster protein [Microvenator marinus]QED26573.1 YkgJ family cysteine cluster protein [Microvenator marinus]
MKSLRFECTGCGECCRKPGWVFFTEEDIATASAFLGISPEEFEERFLETSDGRYYVDVPEESACPFLLDDACTIHSARPVQCRTYPFWPEIVKSPGGWVRERKECPGIDQGRRYSWEEVEAQLRLLKP